MAVHNKLYNARLEARGQQIMEQMELEDRFFDFKVKAIAALILTEIFILALLLLLL